MKIGTDVYKIKCKIKKIKCVSTHRSVYLQKFFP